MSAVSWVRMRVKSYSWPVLSKDADEASLPTTDVSRVDYDCQRTTYGMYCEYHVFVKYSPGVTIPSKGSVERARLPKDDTCRKRPQSR